MALRLLSAWLVTPQSRTVITCLNRNGYTSEPVEIRPPYNYIDGTVLALDQETDIVYPELTLVLSSRGLAQVAIKTIEPRVGIPVGSIFPLLGTDLETILAQWGSSPLPLTRAQNKTSLLLYAGGIVPLNYYSIQAQAPIGSSVPHRVDFTNVTTLPVIHMLGKQPDVQIFDLAGNNIQANIVPTSNDRFDVNFTPAATGYLLY